MGNLREPSASALARRRCPEAPTAGVRVSNDGGVPIFKFHADLTIAVVDGAKSAGGSPSVAPLRDLAVMNVLLADDSSTFRTILKRLLVREFDCTVVEAENGLVDQKSVDRGQIPVELLALPHHQRDL